MYLEGGLSGHGNAPSVLVQVKLPANYKVVNAPARIPARLSLQWCMARCLIQSGQKGKDWSAELMRDDLHDRVYDFAHAYINNSRSYRVCDVTARLFREVPDDYRKAMRQGRPGGPLELFMFARCNNADFYVYVKDPTSGEMHVVHGYGSTLDCRARKAKKQDTGEKTPVLRVVLRDSSVGVAGYCANGASFAYIEDAGQAGGAADGTDDGGDGDEPPGRERTKRTVQKTIAKTTSTTKKGTARKTGTKGTTAPKKKAKKKRTRKEVRQMKTAWMQRSRAKQELAAAARREAVHARVLRHRAQKEKAE